MHNTKEIESLQKLTEETKHHIWHVEEILIRHNLLDKVLQHKDLDSCPLCGKKFEDGDLSIGYGIPIHKSCFDKFLEKEKKE